MNFSAIFDGSEWNFEHSGLKEYDGLLYNMADYDVPAFREGAEPRGPYLIFDRENRTLRTDIFGQVPIFVDEKRVQTGIFSGSRQHDPMESISFGGKLSFSQRRAPFMHEVSIPRVQPEARQIADIFRESVLLRAEGRGKVGLLLSGGVDSSSIATVLAKEGVDFTAFCVSAPGVPYGLEERKDITSARRLARELGIDLVEVVLDVDEVEAAISEIYRIIDMKEYLNSTPVYLPVITSLSITYYFALRAARESGCRNIFSGVGSEELFAGFVDRTGEDLNLQILKRIRTLYLRDLWRDFSLSSHFSLSNSYPFLDRQFVISALSVDAGRKVAKGFKKYIWREAAEILGVPEGSAWRQNRATQYGSGADRVLERIVRRSGKRYKAVYLEHVLDSVESNVGSTSHDRPFL